LAPLALGQTGTSPPQFPTIHFFSSFWNCTKSDSNLCSMLYKMFFFQVLDISCCSLVVARWIYFISVLCDKLYLPRPSVVPWLHQILSIPLSVYLYKLVDAAGLRGRGERDICDARDDGSDDIVVPRSCSDCTHAA